MIGAVHRALNGSLSFNDLLISVVRLLLEMAIAGWPTKWIISAIDVALRKEEHVMNESLWVVKRVMRCALGL